MRLDRIGLIFLLGCLMAACAPRMSATKHYPAPFKDEGSGLYGFRDLRSGKTLIKPRYDMAFAFKEGVSVVCEGCAYNPYVHRGEGDWEGGRWGLLGRDGEELTPLMYERIEPFSEGFAASRLNGKYGYLDRSGELVIPARYAEANAFKEGRAVVGAFGKFGYLDTLGNEIVPIMYEGAYAFRRGLAVVSIAEKYGYIDSEGEVIVPLRYDGIGYYFNGMAMVCKGCAYSSDERDWVGGKFGFVNEQGEEAVPLLYDEVEPFYTDRARVRKDTSWLYIDLTGACVEGCD